MSALPPEEEIRLCQQLVNATRAMEQQCVQLTNEMLINGNSPFMSRADFIKSKFGKTDRDIDLECGYPKLISIDMYKEMYEREGVATRVVNIWPQESWEMDPWVYETEKNRDTSYEVKWNNMVEETNLYHYLERLDENAGVGTCGIMLYGFGDGKKLSQPVDGVTDDPRFEMVDGRSSGFIPLNYLSCFDESCFNIEEIEEDDASPRLGQPLYYKILLNKVEQTTTGKATKAKKQELMVHWSRIHHFADFKTNSNLYGTPRQKPVWNRLMSLRMLLGGSAEMFWKGAFPGFSFEIDPTVASEAKINSTKLREEFTRYANGLQRYLAIVGLTTKSLAPQVASPKDHIAEQLRAIAMTGGYPLRVFMGSEVGKLASDQDTKRWNGRRHHRQKRTLTPFMLRPVAVRLMQAGVVPKPNRLLIDWPDLNAPSSKERSEVGRKMMDALMKYITAGGGQIMAPVDFLIEVFGFTTREAKAIFKAAQANKVATEPVGSTGLAPGSKGSNKPTKPAAAKAKKVR